MRTLFIYLLKNMAKDVYTIIYSVLLPVGLLIGLFLFFDDAAYRKQLLAGVLALNTMMGALNLTAFDVLQPRNRGVLKLVRAAPVKLISFMSIYAAARLVFTFAVNLLVLLAASAGFGIRISPLEVLGTCLIMLAGALPLLGLGIFFGNVAGHEGQVNLLTNLLCFPMIFTSESFYSLEQAPAWAAAVGSVLPYQPFVEGLNAALTGAFALLPGCLLLLALFTAVCWALAAATFRWDADDAVGSAWSAR